MNDYEGDWRTGLAFGLFGAAAWFGMAWAQHWQITGHWW